MSDEKKDAGHGHGSSKPNPVWILGGAGLGLLLFFIFFGEGLKAFGIDIAIFGAGFRQGRGEFTFLLVFFMFLGGIAGLIINSIKK